MSINVHIKSTWPKVINIYIYFAVQTSMELALCISCLQSLPALKLSWKQIAQCISRDSEAAPQSGELKFRSKSVIYGSILSLHHIKVTPNCYAPSNGSSWAVKLVIKLIKRAVQQKNLINLSSATVATILLSLRHFLVRSPTRVQKH